jgi:hypothetical protein
MTLSAHYLSGGMDYATYRALIDKLLLENKTTGPNQSESLFEYAKMNQQRMRRIEAHNTLMPETVQALQAIKKPVLWLAITEGWCGDAAQILPYLAKMTEVNPLIEFKLWLRDENLELMDLFLTNGGRAIPKLIWVEPGSGEVLADWGPRPKSAQLIVLEAKAQQIPVQEYSQSLHSWYAKNKGQQIQEEILQLVNELKLN